jgi:ribosomal protein L22
MVPTCYNIIQNAIKRGLDPFKLFIHGAIIGKTKRFRGVRYHAKSKSGREHRTICQVKIIVE